MAFTRDPRVLKYRGHSRTVLEWAKITGLSSSTIRSRLAAGATDEEALQPSSPRRESRDIVVEIDGVLAPMSKHIEARGLNAETVFQRLDAGADPKEALSAPIRAYKQELTWNGETRTVAEWAEELNLTPACIYSRLRAGKSMEQVLSSKVTPGRPRRGRNRG